MIIKELRHKLKLMSKPSIERLCCDAGLNSVEKHILILTYCENLPTDIIADALNISVSSLSRAKKKTLIKLCDFIDNNMTTPA